MSCRPTGNGKRYREQYNLYVRPTGGRNPIQLTTDGVRYWAYGNTDPRPVHLRARRALWPALEWSPDSRRIAIERTDERHVPLAYLYSSSRKGRPTYHSYPFGMVEDADIGRVDIYMVDVGAKTSVKAQMEPLPPVKLAGFLHDNAVWMPAKWSAGSDRLYVTHTNRGQQVLRLIAVDPQTGAVRQMFEETNQTYLELNIDSSNHRSNWHVVDDGREVLWVSERDGWAHLYLLSDTGAVKKQLTSGHWTVGEILRIDEKARRLYFTARGREPGRDPYLEHLYRVNFDGSGLQLLTPEPADHTVSLSPSGRYIVDTFSRVDLPPVSVLRGAEDGRVILRLEEADISRLLATGWRFPEPFTVKARDGVTDLYGVLYKPRDFDPQKKYPLIDHTYPGPQSGVTPRNFSPSRGNWATVQPMAELGFVMMHLDAMGTPFRSKAFHDAWYGKMGDNGLPDHITAIKQLAGRFSFIDLNRIGIFGSSGGGFASTDAILRYPDFFKVAVSSAGNHDQRKYRHYWGEQYQGRLDGDMASGKDNYRNQDNSALAANLKGKLLLIHGDLDDNVHPSQTLQLVHALIAADKQFDMLVMPDRGHNVAQDPYMIRRTWDYFVQHLLGAPPPVTRSTQPSGG